MVLSDSKTLVVELINRDYGTSYTSSMLDFGPIMELEEGHESLREISVLLTASAASNRVGQRKIYYNRLPLIDVFELPFIEILSTDILTPLDVIAAINLKYQGFFSETDIEIVGFDPENIIGEYIVRALPTSYAFKGEIPLVIGQGLIRLQSIIATQTLNGLEWPEIEDEIEIEEIIEVNHLDGLDYPEETTRPLAQINYYSNVSLDGAVTTESGEMLFGLGHSSEGFMMTENGEIEVCLTAKLHNIDTVFNAIDGVITLPLPDDGFSDWSIALSSAVFGELEGTAITDHYNVKLHITSSEGSTVSLQLVISNITGNYLWLANNVPLSITGSYQSESMDIVQLVKRSKTLAEAFPESLRNEAGALIGQYEIRLEATRRDAPQHSVTASINVIIVDE